MARSTGPARFLGNTSAPCAHPPQHGALLQIVMCEKENMMVTRCKKFAPEATSGARRLSALLPRLLTLRSPSQLLCSLRGPYC